MGSTKRIIMKQLLLKTHLYLIAVDSDSSWKVFGLFRSATDEPSPEHEFFKKFA